MYMEPYVWVIAVLSQAASRLLTSLSLRCSKDGRRRAEIEESRMAIEQTAYKEETCPSQTWLLNVRCVWTTASRDAALVILLCSMS